ncbi:TPA: hypothetical protein ACKPYM_004673 [Stenotrophomonas maltophilia]|nr:hypothetical protein [Stenotrophomonas maltophilia]HEL5350106.1 hypothetical protein [Stenotrophomonas maltophilia]HEL5589148.1 hypothetical protein [Stenotrophomonas maltophilia]HEL5627243.1 hypothetical protein [Stenotrophomonas maltophilia]
MAGFVGIVVLVLLLVVLFNVVASRDRVIRELREQSAQQGRDIASLRQVLDAVADRVLLSREQRRVRWFDELPPFALEDFKSLGAGSERGLIMACGSSDDAEVMGLHYRHDRLEFRSDGEKDAVAYGVARPWATLEDRPVKIYLNQYALTSKIVGLEQDGFVKLAPYRARLPS